MQNISYYYLNSDEDSDPEHYGITCAECDLYPITGVRYMCVECFNYDICSECKNGDVHPGHDMKKITHSLYENAEGKFPNLIRY